MARFWSSQTWVMPTFSPTIALDGTADSFLLGLVAEGTGHRQGRTGRLTRGRSARSARAERSIGSAAGSPLGLPRETAQSGHPRTSVLTTAVSIATTGLPRQPAGPDWRRSETVTPPPADQPPGSDKLAGCPGPWPHRRDGAATAGSSPRSVERVSASLRFDVTAREAEGRPSSTSPAGERGRLPRPRPPPGVAVGPAGRRRSSNLTTFAATRPRRRAGVGDAGPRRRASRPAAVTGSRWAIRSNTPDAEAAEPLGWVDGGLRFDLWMSDLRPGPLPRDVGPGAADPRPLRSEPRYRTAEHDRGHTLVANTAGVDRRARAAGAGLCAIPPTSPPCRRCWS